jgi:D-arabinose 1-dehydrogenase-like Zn-dependent alcohol dehydrogenase
MNTNGHEFLSHNIIWTTSCSKVGLSANKTKPFMRQTKAYATHAADAPLVPFTFAYRDPDPEEIEIQILYCGICHTDVHQARNEWGGTTYPCVPGHEIVGRVTKAGSRVKKFKEGDLAAVGCMVDSCRECASCKAGNEHLCDAGTTFTYNSPDKKHVNSFDFILDTVSAPHDLNAYLELLKADAALTLVGAPAQPLPVSVFNRRDAGDARFLCRTQHRLRRRNHPHPENQRSLRTAFEERREIPLRD